MRRARRLTLTSYMYVRACEQVFYHLGELNDALHYALRAGDLFDVNEENDFVQTLIAKSIDTYV